MTSSFILSESFSSHFIVIAIASHTARTKHFAQFSKPFTYTHVFVG